MFSAIVCAAFSLFRGLVNLFGREKGFVTVHVCVVTTVNHEPVSFFGFVFEFASHARTPEPFFNCLLANLFFLNTPGTTSRPSNDNHIYIALHVCRGYSIAHANSLQDYLPSALKILRFRGNENATYGELRCFFRSVS